MYADRFQLPSYLIRRKVLKIFGGAFHIYAPDGQVVFYSNMKAFKLKEDIRIYTGEDMTQEVLTIKARNIIDFSATYDVVDAETGERVGALRRRGLKSILQDEWAILDLNDQEVGTIVEDSTLLALVRRFLTNLIPQHYSVSLGGRPVAHFRQNFNPFVMKITADFTGDPEFTLDRRMGIASALLLCAVEGKQG